MSSGKGCRVVLVCDWCGEELIFDPETEWDEPEDELRIKVLVFPCKNNCPTRETKR